MNVKLSGGCRDTKVSNISLREGEGGEQNFQGSLLIRNIPSS